MRAVYTLLFAALGGILAGLLRGETAPVPSLTHGGLAPVPVVAVLALIPTIAVVWGWSGLPWQATAASARPPTLLLLPSLVAVPLTFTVFALATGGYGSMLENGRNACGLLGLALIGIRLLGERGAVVVPVSYLLAAFMLGRNPGTYTAKPWAWILTDAGNAHAASVALVLGVLGALTIPTLAQSIIRRGQT